MPRRHVTGRIINQIPNTKHTLGVVSRRGITPTEPSETTEEFLARFVRDLEESQPIDFRSIKGKRIA